MLVLIHVSLEENCDLTKCISTIYEHWKIVTCCPASDVSTCTPEEEHSVKVSRNVSARARTLQQMLVVCVKKPTNAIATYHSARRV